MTTPKHLLPLRVPELGPYLGKILSGTGKRGVTMQLDAIRYKLGTRIIECAGDARRLAVNEERAAALEAVGRVSWQHAWEETINTVADLLLERVSVHIDAEARAVKMGKRMRARMGFQPQERIALRARLACSGADLIPVLDTLAERSLLALDATGLDRAKIESWQDNLKLAARQLEAAWLALEEAVDREALHGRAKADRVALWRKPLWPVITVGCVVAAAAIWLGLVFGGYIQAPAWLARVWQGLFGG